MCQGTRPMVEAVFPKGWAIMKRLAVLVFTAATVAVSGTPANAARATTFPNCTALHKVYPNGVAKPGYRAKPANIRPPRVDAAIYRLNAKSDRDRDGVACEVTR